MPASTRNAGPDAERGDDEAAERRAREARGRLLDDLLQRVGLDEVLGRHDVGHDRAEGRAEERLADAHERGEHDEVPDLDRARDRQHAHPDERGGAHEVGEDQDPAAVRAVGDERRR